MHVATHEIVCKTSAQTDIIDITNEVAKHVLDSHIAEGLVVVGVAGSTASVTTIEYEPGVVSDLRRAIDRIAPESESYAHDERWGDGNGYAHVRAALLGPSLSIDIHQGRLHLGTWQQIVLCDFDNRPRKRSIYVQVLGVKEESMGQ